jgi:hypothetical protein
MKSYFSSIFALFILLFAITLPAAQRSSGAARSWMNAVTLTGIAGVSLTAAGAYAHYQEQKPLKSAQNDSLTLARLSQNLRDIEASLNDAHRICPSTRQKLGMPQRPRLKKYVFLLSDTMREYRDFFDRSGFAQADSALVRDYAVKDANCIESLRFFTAEAINDVQSLKDISSEQRQELNDYLVDLKTTWELPFAHRVQVTDAYQNVLATLQESTKALRKQNKIEIAKRETENKQKYFAKTALAVGITGLLASAYYALIGTSK